jgi:hypothetical protein
MRKLEHKIKTCGSDSSESCKTLIILHEATSTLILLYILERGYKDHHFVLINDSASFANNLNKMNEFTFKA